MSIFGWKFWPARTARCDSAPGSAAIARDRLTVLLAQEGARGARSDLLGALQEKIVALIRRHATLRPEQIRVKISRGAAVSMLAIEVEIPA